MEREQDRWKRLYRSVRGVAGPEPNPRNYYPDHLIVGVALWAGENDRPMCWACQRKHWPGAIRPRELPSQGCLSRRLRTVTVLALLERAYGLLREQLPSGLLKYIDAKPLPVGGCTKDREAGYGRAANCKACGYKLFAIIDAACGAADRWLLGPMNQSEQATADRLLASWNGPALIVGDGEYDVSRLYDHAAQQDAAWLASAPPADASLGHHYQSPHRRNGLALVRSSAGAMLLMARIGIEQSFGNWTSFGGGLGPLPAWVRTPHRVAVWLAIKFLIDLDRRIQLTKQKATAA